MTEKEFLEIMYENGIYATYRISGNCSDAFIWNDIMFFHKGFRVNVNGRIPLEVANEIFKKYEGNPYKINVEGGAENWDPNDWATDDEHEKNIRKLMNSGLTSEDFIKMADLEREKLKERLIENKYIKGYHIFTKYGLQILIDEIKKYYEKKGLEQQSTVFRKKYRINKKN